MKTKKTLALLLAIVMVMMTIPAGIFTVGAAEEATIDLYDNTEEIQPAADAVDVINADVVIRSIEDWKAVATSGSKYEGKTVALACDLDFEGAVVTPLFNSNSFRGEFNGSGHTISNAVVNGASHTALIAPKLDSGKITNVKFDNITVTTTGGNVGLIAGKNTNMGNLEISKIKATNITVNNSSTANTGGLIGLHENNGYETVVTQINFQGAVNHNNQYGNVGGIVGQLQVNGTTKFSKIDSNVALFVNQSKNASYAGGFIGSCVVGSGYVAEIEDVYVHGSFDANGSSTRYNAGFVGMFKGTAAGQDIANIKNVILAMDMTKAYGKSVVFANVTYGNLVYEGVYSTNSSNGGISTTTSIRWTGISGGTGSFNGVSAKEESADPIKNTIKTVGTEEASRMVFRDQNGFIQAIVEFGIPVIHVKSNLNSVRLNKTVTFYLVVENCHPMKGMGLVPIFDSSVFELVEAKWLIPATIQNIEEDTLNSVSAWSESTDVNKTVYKITLRAKATTDATKVDFSVSMQNDSGTITADVIEKTIEVVCSHEDVWYDYVDENGHDVYCYYCEKLLGYVEHSWVEATCAEPQHCSGCGATVGAPSDQHTWDEGYISSFPTCTTAGEKIFACNVCGENYVETIPAYGHHVILDDPHDHSSLLFENNSTYPSFELVDGQYVSTNKADSSFSYMAITAVEDCTLAIEYGVSSEQGFDFLSIYYNGELYNKISGDDCEYIVGMTLSAGDMITIVYSKDGSQSKNQDEGYFSIGAPADLIDVTCTENVICSICHEEAKPALDHTPEIIPGYDATCTENGLTDRIVCSVCGEVLQEHEMIPATGHKYGGWIIVREATMTEEGLMKKVCNDCGHEVFEVIPKLDSESNIVLPFVTTSRGSTVKVPVYLEGNPGVSGMIVTIKYDTSAMTLVNVENGEIMSTMSWGANIVFSNTPDSTLSGLLATLTFEIKDDAALGDYTVECILRECVNSALENVTVGTVNGIITVEDFIYGDVNGDRKIDLKDLVVLGQYLADYDYDLGESTVEVWYGADVDGNKTVDLNDIILLNLYFANYDYDTGVSSVVLGPNA